MNRKTPFLLIIMLAFILSACGGGTVSSAPDILTTALESVPEDTLRVLMDTDSSILERYYGLSDVECADFAGKVSLLNVSATEILIVRAKKNNAEAVTSALEARINELAAQWETSREDQYQLVKNAQIVQNGDWLLLVVAEHANVIAEAFLENTSN